jgi:hypothetical protein
MSNEVMKPKQTSLDGFDAFDDAVEGEDERSTSGRVIQGTLLKFTNEAAWITNAEEKIPDSLVLAVVDIARVVQKWKDQSPIETIILAPGEKYPDVKKLNEACPQTEWTESLSENIRRDYKVFGA